VSDRPSPFKLAALLFFNAAALGMWSVSFGNVLKAQGYESIIEYAYACGGIAAFISPLAVGALADQHIPPTRLLRLLCVFAAAALSLNFAAIQHHWSPLVVLACTQLQYICSIPIFGLNTSIVLSSLENPGREFGPLRAAATVGWMIAGWLVSFVLHADTSALNGYAASVALLCTAACTYTLPETPPVEHKEARDLFGLEALKLFSNKNHRVVFLTAAFLTIALAPYYPYTPIHLSELGVEHPTAAMTLGQISELLCMFGLAGLLARWRLKWVFATGMVFGVLRFAFYSLNSKAWVLAGISLHGFAYTLYFITAQIYLEQRVEPRMRARAQALLSVMASGFGNLIGYLGSGRWERACTSTGHTNWPVFWIGMSGAVLAVLVWFVFSYRGREARTEGDGEAA
jgi:nucleoside transporter